MKKRKLKKKAKQAIMRAFNLKNNKQWRNWNLKVEKENTNNLISRLYMAPVFINKFISISGIAI